VCGSETSVTVVGRLLRTLSDGEPQALFNLATADDELVASEVWADSRLVLPAGWPTEWRDVITGRLVSSSVDAGAAGLRLGELLGELPVAVLEARPAAREGEG
jgi:hypothetical protein